MTILLVKMGIKSKIDTKPNDTTEDPSDYNKESEMDGSDKDRDEENTDSDAVTSDKTITSGNIQNSSRLDQTIDNDTKLSSTDAECIRSSNPSDSSSSEDTSSPDPLSAKSTTANTVQNTQYKSTNHLERNHNQPHSTQSRLLKKRVVSKVKHDQPEHMDTDLDNTTNLQSIARHYDVISQNYTTKCKNLKSSNLSMEEQNKLLNQHVLDSFHYSLAHKSIPILSDTSIARQYGDKNSTTKSKIVEPYGLQPSTEAACRKGFYDIIKIKEHNSVIDLMKNPFLPSSLLPSGSSSLMSPQLPFFDKDNNMILSNQTGFNPYPHLPYNIYDNPFSGESSAEFYKTEKQEIGISASSAMKRLSSEGYVGAASGTRAALLSFIQSSSLTSSHSQSNSSMAVTDSIHEVGGVPHTSIHKHAFKKQKKMEKEKNNKNRNIAHHTMNKSQASESSEEQIKSNPKKSIIIHGGSHGGKSIKHQQPVSDEDELSDDASNGPNSLDARRKRRKPKRFDI